MKKLANTLRFLFIFLVFVLLITPSSFLSLASTDSSSPLSTTEVNASWMWSEYEILSDTSTLDSKRPSIALDSEDNIHVVWYDNTDLLGSDSDIDIFYRYYDISLETWSPIELVSTESTLSSYSPVIAIDSSDNVHVAWDDSTDYIGAGTDIDVFYKKKNAGGFWTTTEVISTESVYYAASPSMSLDSNDNVYFSWADITNILGADLDQDIFLRYYNCTSATFADTILISTQSTENSFDPEIVIDSLTGDVHVVWEDYLNILGAGSDLDVFYCNWNVYTSILSTFELVSEGSISASQDPKIQLDQNGDVHIIWVDGNAYYDSDIDYDMFYRLRVTSSGSWNNIELVSTESVESSSQPTLALDRKGSVYVAWHDYTDYLGSDDGGSDWDIFFKFKDSTLNQWSLTDVVSVESSATSEYPSIILDSSDFVHCIWAEIDDLGGSGADTDIFYRKLAGNPIETILSPILPNPSSPDNISLNWKKIQSADEYLVYRSESYIWSISDIEPLAIVTENTYFDTINETGTFYYAICARNEYGYSTLSNVEHVIVEDNVGGLFSSLNLTEILIITGIVLGLQVIGSIITYALVKGSVETKGKSKKRKK